MTSNNRSRQSKHTRKEQSFKGITMKQYQKPQHNTQRGRSIPAKNSQREGTSSSDSVPVSAVPESLLDINGLCQFLKLGKTKIFWLINREGLPAHKFGRAYRFDHIEVWQWLQKRRDLV
jgi:excisionase family DNA binding protein